jgi:hypothetical protein
MPSRRFAVRSTTKHSVFFFRAAQKKAEDKASALAS